MARILVYLTAERRASLFDAIVSYDSGVSVVLPCEGVLPEEVAGLVYDAVFARSPRDLKDLALFVGGRDLRSAGGIFSELSRVVCGLDSNLRVSVAQDPFGAYTTAAAVIAKTKGVVGPLGGKKVLVLAGTGPVGMASACFFALEGAKTRLTSRRMESAKKACETINGMYRARVRPAEVGDGGELESALEDASVLVSCGPEGKQLVPEKIWRGSGSLEVLVDTNAVPPEGIECVLPGYDSRKISGKTCFGALAVGDLKMRVQKRMLAKLFEKRGLVFGAKEIKSLPHEVLK